MNGKDDLPLNALSPSDLLRWRAMLDLLKEQEAEMKARHAAEELAHAEKVARLDRLIVAAEAFVEIAGQDQSKPTTHEAPTPTQDAPSPEKPIPATLRMRRGKGKSWTATLLKIIHGADRGLNYKELRSEVAKTHLGETLERTDKAFYGGVGKLAKSKKIVRYKGHIFSPAAFKRFQADVAAGRVQDLRDSAGVGSRESANEVAIKRFLAGRPDGAPSGEIADSLLNNPPPDLDVTRNRNSIYNLLVRLRGRGTLIRRGERYYLPSHTDDAPGSKGPGASDDHGGGGGSLSSSGSMGTPTSLAASPVAKPAHSGM